MVISLIGLLLLPFYTRYLSPVDFGLLALYLLFGHLVTNLISIGIQTATSRYYFKEKNNIDEFRATNFNNILYLLFALFLGAVIVFFFADFISIYLFKGKLTKDLVLISYFAGCLTRLYAYFSKLLVAQERAMKYALIEIFKSVSIAIFSIFFILQFSLTYQGRIFGEIIGLMASLIIVFFLQVYYVKILFSIKKIKRSLLFSLPALPVQTISLVNSSVDKIMINNLKNLGELGYYELSQRMSQMNRLLIDSTFYAWTPYFMNLAEQKSDNYSEKIVKRYFEIIAFFSILSITFCFFSEEIVKLLTTTQFYPAMYLMPLMASQIFIQNSCSSLFKPQVMFAEKMSYTIPPTLVYLVLNIIFNFLLIPVYGALGAALALLISGMFSSVFQAYLGQKAFYLPVNYLTILVLLSLYAVFILIVYFLMSYEISIFYKILFKFFLVMFYSYLLIVFKIIEYSRIKEIIYKIKNILLYNKI